MSHQDISKIRKLIHEEFSKFIKKAGKTIDSNAQYPTEELIHQKIRDSGEFDEWSLSTTKSIINSMGFRFVRAHAVNHSALIENKFIVDWRKRFIRKIREYRNEGRNIVFFDESYVNANHCPDRVLTDTTIVSAKDAEERGLTTGMYAVQFQR